MFTLIVRKWELMLRFKSKFDGICIHTSSRHSAHTTITSSILWCSYIITIMGKVLSCLQWSFHTLKHILKHLIQDSWETCFWESYAPIISMPSLKTMKDFLLTMQRMVANIHFDSSLSKWWKAFCVNIKLIAWKCQTHTLRHNITYYIALNILKCFVYALDLNSFDVLCHQLSFPLSCISYINSASRVQHIHWIELRLVSHKENLASLGFPCFFFVIFIISLNWVHSTRCFFIQLILC